jgi:tRNA(adenine34) deaminase
VTYLCLHGPTSWSYHYRFMLAQWLALGHRVVVPDLIGFGKSDKPKKDSFHQWPWHRQVLVELVQRLDLRNIVLVQPKWAQPLDLRGAAPQRFVEQREIELTTDPTGQGDNAPYPDRGHRAALRAFSQGGSESMRYSNP